MLICAECGAVFENRHEYNENLGGFIRYFSGCPNCRSECIREAEECQICDTWCDPEEDKIIDAYICSQCANEIKAELWDIAEKYNIDEDVLLELCDQLYDERRKK